MFDLANAEDDFCYLTTRGRVSGQPHEIEIWFTADDDTLYMLAGARRPLRLGPEPARRAGGDRARP